MRQEKRQRMSVDQEFAHSTKYRRLMVVTVFLLLFPLAVGIEFQQIIPALFSPNDVWIWPLFLGSFGLALIYGACGTFVWWYARPRMSIYLFCAFCLCMMLAFALDMTDELWLFVASTFAQFAITLFSLFVL